MDDILMGLVESDYSSVSDSTEESNSSPPEHRAGALSTELRDLLENKVILTEFRCDRRPAYC